MDRELLNHIYKYSTVESDSDKANFKIRIKI